MSFFSQLLGGGGGGSGNSGFSSGGIGNSTPTTNTQNTTTNESTTVNNIDNRIWNTTTDNGAVSSAFSFAGDTTKSALLTASLGEANALSFSGDVTAKSLGLVGYAVGRSLDAVASADTKIANANTESTGLSNHALDLASAVNGASLDFASKINTTAVNSIGSAYGSALTAVRENTDNTTTVIENLASKYGDSLANFFSNEQTQLGNVVSALNSTYTANNTSANQQVINAVTGAGSQLQSTIKIIVIGIAAAGALYFLAKKG